MMVKFTSGGLLVLAGLALMALTFVAAVILLVVGIVRKRTGMWVLGIILGVLPLLILPIGGAFVFFRAVAAPVSTVAYAKTTAAPRDGFRQCTGLELPAGTRILSMHNVNYGPAVGRSYYAFRVQVPPDFASFLEANFAKAQWEDVREALTRREILQAGTWREADVRERMYFTREHRDDPDASDGMVTAVAYDPNSGRAYIASQQQWDR